MEKLKKWLPSRRKIVQLYFGLLLNANLKGFVTGNIYKGGTKILCAPGINCYSCPGAVGACPLGSLQGSFSADHSTIYYVCGILALYGVLLGRMICGWICPFGLIQELLHKIPTPKIKKGPLSRLLSYFKYILLVFFVFIVPIVYAFKDTPLPTFCKYICPAGTLEGGLGLLANKVNASYFSMLGPLFTWKFMLMISILVGCVFIFRLFCRFLCPLGALYGLFNGISFFGVKLERSKCIDCGLCVSRCEMDIRHVGDQECISCGACVDVCPTKAIVWKGPKVFLHPNETDEPTQRKKRTLVRSISALLMAVLLMVGLVYFWIDSPVMVARGNEVGSTCYGYDLEIIDSNGLTGGTIDPSATGQITIINFWGTWCTPCVNELPYFDQIASEYEDVTVIAIHTNMVCETAPGYLASHYPDSEIVFCQDYLTEDDLEGYYTTLGGRGAYPYTIVLDENGIISQIFFSSVNYEDLKTAVDALS